MRVACLQFCPVLGDVDNNLNRADSILSRASPKDIDLLVLPELAFSGYNFKSLQHIAPYLEPSGSGITALWARTTALKYDCVVTVGYPEKVDVTDRWPASPEYYNASITVNADGETVANYRKSFLYYTDETWALEGADGFYDGEIEGLGIAAIGICMDLKFEMPWTKWEFAYHVLHKEANVVILSMAWLTREDARAYSRAPKDPDMETLSYWVARLEPLIRAETEGEIVVVICNRCGVEEDAVYAGTSTVLGIEGGEVKVYGILGRGEKALLVVDTSDEPLAKLVADGQPTLDVSNADDHPTQISSDRPIPVATKDGPTSEELVASIDAVLAAIPVSPVEPMFPHHYFSDIKDLKPDERRGGLFSSASARPRSEYSNSPTSPHDLHNVDSSSIASSKTMAGTSSIPSDDRPTSPKSRNASRTRISTDRGEDAFGSVEADLIKPSARAALPVIAVGPPVKVITLQSAADVEVTDDSTGISASRRLSHSQRERIQILRPKSTGWWEILLEPEQRQNQQTR